jgi:glycosyltransferase involved in cell wall biosynthesis
MAIASPNVKFIGTRTPKEIPGILANARALIQPSRCHEAQPRAILEAFAAGVPVVATRVGGVPELIEDGKNGVLLDFNRADDLRDAIERLSDDHESLLLGEGAGKTWRDKFTPEHALRNLEAAYRHAINVFNA